MIIYTTVTQVSVLTWELSTKVPGNQLFFPLPRCLYGVVMNVLKVNLSRNCRQEYLAAFHISQLSPTEQKRLQVSVSNRLYDPPAVNRSPSPQLRYYSLVILVCGEGSPYTAPLTSILTLQAQLLMTLKLHSAWLCGQNSSVSWTHLCTGMNK